MRSGVKIKDIVAGTGDEAIRGKTVAANVRLFLNRGTELNRDGELMVSLTGGPRVIVDLARRECIPGLRYGIEGMRVGGQRELIISPHLAYGPTGVPGHVPSNAVLRAHVELLDVREPGVRKPEDYPPGKHLFVFHPGQRARNQPRWQFGLEENGRCGVTVTRPISGMAWRRVDHSQREAKLDVETTRSLFDGAMTLPDAFPKDCFGHEDLWTDMAEKGNAITRDRINNALCLTIGVMERGQWLCDFGVAETSQALLDLPLMRVINGLLLESEDRTAPDKAAGRDA